MKHKFSLILFFTVISSLTFSQEKLIIKLQQEINLQKSAGKKAVLQGKLAEIIRFNNSKKSIDLIYKAINISKKNASDEDLANVYLYSIKVLKQADSIEQMVSFMDKAFDLAKKTKNDFLIGKAYQYKAFVEMNLNEDEKSLHYTIQSLHYLEKKNAFTELSRSYYYLFGMFAERGDLDKAKIYADLCLKNSLKANNPDMICTAYQAKGTYFSDLFRKNKNPADFVAAIEHFKKGLVVFSHYQDEIITQNQFGIIALNIADLYFQNYQPSYKNLIIEYTNLALNHAKKINDLPVITNVYLIQSELADKEKNTKKAEQLLLTAESVIEKDPFKDMYLLSSVYKTLASFYEKEKNTIQTLKYYKKYVDSYQSLNDIDKKKNLRLLEARFQTRKKEEKLQLLTQTNRLQKKLNYLYLILIGLGILGLIILYRALQFKIKFEKQKSMTLSAQKEEAELLVKLNKEENSRLETERKLIEVQKSQLQKELLAGALHVEHKNELFFQLKEKLSKENLDTQAMQKINHLLKEEKIIDKNFDKLRIELQNIHPEFYDRIQSKTQHKLTSLDLKYCAAIYMKLNNSEMALLFNVEAKSIRMNKYRLKQKLGLSKECSLENWIMNKE